MKLDPVHDVQKAFRKILEAMASPGSVVDLAAEAELLDLELPVNRGILIVALALLDAETSFCVVSGNASASTDAQAGAISHLTYAKIASPADADFIFVLGPASCSSSAGTTIGETPGAGAAGAIAAANPGTLVDPHLGATIVVEVAAVTEEGPLRLSGPGIASEARLGVGADPAWMEARRLKNAEFPLGVDILFVDGHSRLAALPRTTVMTEGT
jgi:alpha-D-ribose 1-methylphosphonate 5-triphosphate synthase subunit PhnH